MDNTYTYTRQEIVEAAKAALDNWDFNEWPALQAPLQAIVDGIDDVGAEEPVMSFARAYVDRDTALWEWLQDHVEPYAVSQENEE